MLLADGGSDLEMGSSANVVELAARRVTERESGVRELA